MVRIGLSFCSQVYRVERDGQVLAQKVFTTPFSPLMGLLYKLANGSGSIYPYAIEVGVEAAYYKRRIAHRLSRFLNRQTYVVDAIAQCEWGFYSPFAEGKPPRTRKEHLYVQKRLALLEAFFQQIGMPTWSFGHYYTDWTWPLRRNNIILGQGEIRIVDYEELVPILSRKGLTFLFDGVNLERVSRFVQEQAQELCNRISPHELKNLQEALEGYAFCISRLHLGKTGKE